MKKVKNPRSGLSWSEITLVLIKKTIRLVLKFESGWRCCFWRWADWCSCCTSVVPSCFPATPSCLWQPLLPSLQSLGLHCLPLWHSVGSHMVLPQLLKQWLCVGLHGWCLAQSLLHVVVGVRMPQAPSCGDKLVSCISRCLCNSASRSTPYSSVLPSVVHNLSWIINEDRWATGVAVKNIPCYGEDRRILQLS